MYMCFMYINRHMDIAMEQTFFFFKQDPGYKIGIHNITENGFRKMSKIWNCQVWMWRYARRSSAFHLLSQHFPAYKCLSSSLICFRIFREDSNNIVASDLKFHKWGKASFFLRLLNTIYVLKIPVLYAEHPKAVRLELCYVAYFEGSVLDFMGEISE